MVEPRLGLIVSISEGRLDDAIRIKTRYSTVIKAIGHSDDSSNSIHRHSISQIYDYVENNAALESAESVSDDFIVWEKCGHRCLQLIVDEHGKPLALDSRIVDSCAPLLSFDSYKILPEILGASLELPVWDRLAKSCGFVTGEQVAMFVGPLTARRFFAQGVACAEVANAEGALFRQRAIR